MLLAREVLAAGRWLSRVSSSSRWFEGHARLLSSLPPHLTLTMPSLSPTMEKGNLSKWVKAEGDAVAAGDVVAEIETDKASMEMDSQEEGFLAKILVPGGTNDVDVGTPIAILAEDEDDVGKFADYAAPSTAGAPKGGEAGSAAEAASTSGDAPLKADRIGPAVQRLVRQMNIDLTSVVGTGPFGIVTKGDLLNADAGALATKEAAVASEEAAGVPAERAEPAAGEYEDVPHTTVRKIIAKGLLDSKTAFPHQYATVDVQLDALLKFRKDLKEMGVVASVNDYIVKAVALSLKETPQMNAYWDEEAREVKQNDTVDIAVAVATDGGLITPVIFEADGKKVSSINAEVEDLAARARANKLMPHEFQGGTFTISNLGMFGIKEFSAIINPYGTQGCIMAVGGGQERVQFGKNGELEGVTVMTCQISADGRAFGGQAIASFLKTFAVKMENPSSLFV